MNGIGRANYGDMIYEGQFKNGFWSGYGRAIWKDGSYHTGFFSNDRKNGPGMSVHPIKGIKKEDPDYGKWVVEEGIWTNDLLTEVKRQETVENSLG